MTQTREFRTFGSSHALTYERKISDVPIKFHHSQDPAIHLLVMFWFMFSARIKLFGKHFNIFCLFESILIVFSILVIIWNAEYRSPIRRFVNNWLLSRRAYNFPGRSTQDYSLEQADDYKHLSSMDDLEPRFILKFSLQKEQNRYSSLSPQARSWIRSLFPHSNEQGFLRFK